MYEYSIFHKRTLDGWELIQIPGEVHIDDSEKEIKIINQNAYIIFNWTSKLPFIRTGSYLYRLNDWRGIEVTMKIDYIKGSDNIELYYYSDEPGNQYFKLFLTLCKN